MRLTIYDASADTKPIAPVCLRLVKRGEAIELVAVNEYGDRMTRLLEIKPDGTFRRCAFVDARFGFSLDVNSRIVESV